MQSGRLGGTCVTHYRYKGDCREMRFFNAGVLRGPAARPTSKSPFGRRCTVR